MLSEVFFIALTSSVSGVILKLASLAYKSKCSEVSFCGLKITRNVSLETPEEIEVK